MGDVEKKPAKGKAKSTPAAGSALVDLVEVYAQSATAADRHAAAAELVGDAKRAALLRADAIRWRAAAHRLGLVVA